MKQFNYIQAQNQQDAMTTVTQSENSFYLAGGTDLLGLMKDGVQTPNQLIDINLLSFNQIEETNTGIIIGALAKMSDVANYPLIKNNYPVLSQSLLNSASPQLRNMATIGGNLNQKVRCNYFRNPLFPCNKRSPGSGCSAIEGYNRNHAILGTSNHCIAVHPSDLAVALMVLDATIQIQNETGIREVPISEYYLLPNDTPEKENILNQGELITSIFIPKSNLAQNSYYLKVRDRASYEFALVSAGVALEISDNVITSSRIVLGGVAGKPWRSLESEAHINHQSISLQIFTEAAEIALQNARSYTHNHYKIDLAKRTLIKALSVISGGEN